MTFKPIETQEEFNEMIFERIGQAKDSVRKEYAGYISPEDFEKKTEDMNKQIASLNDTIAKMGEEKAGFEQQIADKTAELEKQIADKDSKIANYEIDSVKTKIALENGIPYQMACKLSGTTEEEIRTDAIKMAEFLVKPSGPPMAGTEGPDVVDGVTAEFLKLNPNLKLK